MTHLWEDLQEEDLRETQEEVDSQLPMLETQALMVEA